MTPTFFRTRTVAHPMPRIHGGAMNALRVTAKAPTVRQEPKPKTTKARKGKALS